MSKVGIVTIYDNKPNYGNRLQNYASIQLFKQLGFDVCTLVAEEQQDLRKIRIKSVINRLAFEKLSNSQAKWIQLLEFRKFGNKYLNPSFELLDGTLNINDYSYFAVGSDQVWNPEWYFGIKKEAFLLTFANQRQKICMAPSFGVENLPAEWEEWFSDNLKTFPSISVREEQGAKIIEKLTSKKATVVLDPTLMLTCEQWEKIKKRPKKINTNKKYILTYFLGGIDEKEEKVIKELEDNIGASTYKLMDNSQPNVLSCGPCEFLYLIENAELILTDSFHACVFSFLFNKSFLVFDRNGTNVNMNSRLTTLLSKFKLERKYFNSGLENDIWEHDYTEGYRQLEIERKKSFDFLENALKDQ